MAENESTTIGATEALEAPKSQEITEELLAQKVKELGELEKKLFNTDGKIGDGSHDSLIDKEYEKAIKDATTIKAKVDLIDHLINDFGKDGDISGIMENEKTGKYIDDEDRVNIKKIEEKLNDLAKRYPEMKDQIKKFILREFQNTNYYADYYEKTGDKNHLNAIKPIYKGSHQGTLDVYIPRLEQAIKDINKNPFITDKKSFVNYIVQDDNFSKIGEEGIGGKLNTLFQYDFIKENFSDDEKSSNYNDTFGYGTLVRLFEVDQNQLQKINTLYKNPEKAGELVKIMDTLPIPIKEGLLSSKKLLEIYGDYKKGSLALLGNGHQISEIPNQVIVKLGNIKDSAARQAALNYMLEVKKTNSRSPLFTKGLEMQSTVRTFEITDFVSEGGQLDNLIQAQTNTLDKINIIKVFETFISSEYRMSVVGGGNLEEKILSKLSKLQQQQQEDIIEKEIVALKEKFKNNPEVLVQIEHDLTRTGGKPNDGISNKLAVLSNTYGTHHANTQQNRPTETKPIQEIQKPQVKEANATLNKMGAGGKFQVDENGKMVSAKYLEKKQQAIAKGETPPKEEKINDSIQLGRKGQIEFGANGEMVFTSSLGYKFELENDIYGINKALDVTETFDYMDKIGLGYFGNNLKGMIDSIPTYLPNQASFLSIDESSGNFLSIYELHHIIIPIFQNVGFIDKSQNLDPLAPEQMSDTVMSHRVSQIPGGDAFTKGKAFNKSLFGELLQNTNKV